MYNYIQIFLLNYLDTMNIYKIRYLNIYIYGINMYSLYNNRINQINYLRLK